MIRWLAARLAQAAATLAVVAVILFFVVRLAPGDPISHLVGERAVSAEELAQLCRRHGCDRPLPEQFAAFVGGLARGDLGVSFSHHRPVGAVMLERLPKTLLLGATVLLLNFTVGLALGVLQAVHRGGAIDQVLTGASLVAYATPSFWLGIVLVWLFSLRWHLLPAGGFADPLLDHADLATRLADVGRHLVLPALTLSAVTIAATMRYQRGAMLEVLRRDFIRTARAKGLPERRITWRHAWRAALFPVLTLFGLWLPLLATGSVFVESVFAWPGLGLLAYDAIGSRDYPLVMGTSLLVSALVIAGGVLTDLAYFALDPRLRHEALGPDR
ncbi:MAG TPA: ABC transporter permease [Gemmatimonadales bacterium]|nr:ABC transporter permease [Gemmatimonadales bacterium]